MTPRDPGDALLAAFAARLGPLRDVTRAVEDWRSATFSGCRYAFDFRVGSDAAIADFQAEIGDAEIALRRGFVADVTVIDVTPCENGHCLRVEALTIDEV